MSESKFIEHSDYKEYPVEEMRERARSFYADVKRRRTVRDFSDREVPREIIENCIRAAGTAPNGANKQPWHFAVVSDPEVKKEIREAAEEEEQGFYENRATDEWLEALAPLGTDADKPFLEEAPLILSRYFHSVTVSKKTVRRKTIIMSKNRLGLQREY